MEETTGTSVSISTICNFLHKNGFSRRKLSRIALQRSDELRAQFIQDISIYNPEMLVFIDETGSNSRDARRKFGYSLRGKPAKAVSLYGRGKHLSAISAISVEGSFGCHITEGRVDAEVFQQFLDQYLIPKLMPFNGTNPHSVVILDNAAIHHIESVVASLEGLGVLPVVHFLPPYSPDKNAIEECFAKVKSVMKENEVLLDAGELETLILMGFASITQDDCIRVG